jgi:hypothetical protein
MRALLAIGLFVTACGNASPREPITGSGSGSALVDPGPELPRWSDAWVNREGKRFAEDDAYRRAALEASLVNHANTYSQQRLGSYALVERGWDVLPVWNPRSRPVTKELAAQLERGEMPDVPDTHEPLWDGKTPTTLAGWVALGKKVFFEYPMRAEVFMEWGLMKPDVAAQVGVERTADGNVPGLVVFANVDGRTRVGITCAICHSAMRDGELVVGAARRTFDYGRLRLAYFEDTKARVEAELARRMATWDRSRARHRPSARHRHLPRRAARRCRPRRPVPPSRRDRVADGTALEGSPRARLQTRPPRPRPHPRPHLRHRPLRLRSHRPHLLPRNPLKRVTLARTTAGIRTASDGDRTFGITDPKVRSRPGTP